MMKEGIDVYGYRRNYHKARAFETSGYITKAAVDSIQDLVHLVSYDDYDHKVPGVYQLVIPELVEETIHGFTTVAVEILLLIMAIANFKDSQEA